MVAPSDGDGGAVRLDYPPPGGVAMSVIRCCRAICASRCAASSALRTAKAEGLIVVEWTGRRNTITVSATWKAWLDRYGLAPPDGPC
jgi:hypothetical protein